MVYGYDTTLRDGAQTPGLPKLDVEGKLYVTRLIAELGVPYIEGGWPGSNPTDTEYFQRVREEDLPNKPKIFAFGMTAKTKEVESDPLIQALVEANPDGYTIVGKSDSRQVSSVLGLGKEEYLEIIRNTISYLSGTGKPVFYDAEHFFDGFRHDPEYAMATLRAAEKAECLVLCDTKGGSFYDEISET